MKFIALLLLSCSISSAAFAAQKLTCTHYVYSGVPFATVTLKLDPDGHVERFADITYYGVTQKTAVQENAKRDDQLYNLTLDADRPGEEIFLEIYKPADSLALNSFKAKLINPQSPAGKEMAGSCDLTE